MLATEERVDQLESIFRQFMAGTDMILRELSQNLEQYRAESSQNLEQYRAESSQNLEQYRAESSQNLEQYRQEGKKDRREASRNLEQYREEGEKDRRELAQDLEQYRAEGKKDRRELARQLGDISNRLGRVVEDMIVPSLRRIAREELDCGEELFFAERITITHPQDPARRREFEGLYVGDKAILLNESKATVRPEYASDFVKFVQSGEFSHFFPEYEGRPIVAVFSSLYIPQEVVKYLSRHGIYAVGIGDTMMEILNKDEAAAAPSV